MDTYLVCNKCGHVEKIDDVTFIEDYGPTPCCPICYSANIFTFKYERIKGHSNSVDYTLLWDKIKKASDNSSRKLELENMIKKAKSI